MMDIGIYDSKGSRTGVGILMDKGNWHLEHQLGPDSIHPKDEMVEIVRRDLSKLHLGADDPQASGALASQDVDSRYFIEFYSEDAKLCAEDRLKSAYVGAIVYGQGSLAYSIYKSLLLGIGRDKLNTDLVERVAVAMKAEFKSGEFSRYDNLRLTAKELGMPARKRAGYYIASILPR